MKIIYKYKTDTGVRLGFDLDRLEEANQKLNNGLGGSNKWKDLNLDDNYRDSLNSWLKFEEIEIVVNEAWRGKESNPLATLWHWAARCNKSWPISQFLKDPIACESFMALDSNGKTALDIANECKNKFCH
jgi:hypothetical protein